MKSLKNFPSTGHRILQPRELLPIYKILRKEFGHQHWWPGDSPFEVILGAILTQNTAWTNVEKAIANLKREGQLTPKALRKTSVKRLAKLIRPAGYFNVKAARLKNFIAFIFKEYGGNIPKMFKEPLAALRPKLLSVNGIGPETADSILLYAGSKPTFVIDAYTRRIFSRHHLMPADHSYEQWRALFEKSLPKSVSLYNDYHAQIVHLAKAHCRSVPRCETCPLKSYL